MRVPNLKSAIAQDLVLVLTLFPAAFSARSQEVKPAARPAAAQPAATDLPDAPLPAGRASSPFGKARLSAAAQPETARLVTVLEDTDLELQIITPVNMYKVNDGDPLLFLVSEDVLVDGAVAIPRGAEVRGAVVRYRKSGTLTGAPELTLKLVSLQLGNRNYPLYSHLLRVKGLSKTRPTERKVITGAAVGALVGGVAVSEKGGVTGSASPAGMGAGAVVGAGVGTAVAAIAPGPNILIPSESGIEFSLAAPITIVPVSADEAARLSEGLSFGGPYLYVRGETP